MNPQDLEALSLALRRLLAPRLSESADWRTVARVVGAWLIAEANRAEPLVDETTPPAGSQTPSVTPVSAAAEPAPPEIPTPKSVRSDPVAPKAPWTIGDLLKVATGDRDRPAPAVAPAPSEGDRIERDDPELDPLSLLDLIEHRTALKASSCRLVIERRATEHDHALLTPVLTHIGEALVQAKALPTCFLWALWRDRTPPDDEVLATIADCYDALSAAAALVRRMSDSEMPLKDDEWVGALTLMAEANSSLRVALKSSWLTTDDVDQDVAHVWLRQEVERRQLWVSRFMRLDDPGDPGAVARLKADIEAKRAAMDERVANRARVRDGFGVVAYHARRADRDGSRDHYNLTRIAEAVEALLGLGIPPTDRRFAEKIPPHVAERVLTTGPAAVRVVMEYLRHAAKARAEVPQAGATAAPWSADVERARGLLAGKRVVMIGGQVRSELATRIETAFDLSSLEWVRMTEHGTSEPMRGPIVQPETALVLVLIRLTGHQHAENAAAIAKGANTPCVVLTAGYSPEQIARAVLDQASVRLGASV